MTATATSERRSRGRPQVRPDEETHRLIAEAARTIFTSVGYSGASMDEVAKVAGVSKKTLYRLVPTKAAIFKASIHDRIERFILALDEDALSPLPVRVALERIMTEYGTLTLSRETVAIQKLVIAERDRFPELASSFYLEAVVATQGVLARFLERQLHAGVIDVEDPEEAAGMLRGMMIMEPQRAAMLGQRPVPTPAEITDRARACVRLFLAGCQTRTGRAP